MALLIAQELLLVAYREDGTAWGKSTELECALGGALLVELALAGNVELVGSQVMAAGTAAPPVHPELADALTRVAAKPRRPKAWVQRLAKGARRRLLADLVEQGVLTEERYRLLGLLPARRYPPVDAGPKREIESRLRAVLVAGQRPDQRTAALASMLSAARLERRVLPDEDHRLVKQRLREIAESDWLGPYSEAVRKAVQAAHAATAAAASAASTSAASSGG
ncbi:GOLPH3/VPS74 family protein [Pseudonocardia spinosispora]|uniref:GOLPH3/VPS74 family protein n=1 Tax=Pseudonocardia spinosispora TaxID=103441 RepID=UPI00041EEA0F|nr:GPP34 family phosphoprotein [Pseudonocardia spinosispora]